MNARRGWKRMEPDGSVGGSDASLSNSAVDAGALDWLAALGWAVAQGPDVAPDTPVAERTEYGSVVLTTRLRSALGRLNLDLPNDALGVPAPTDAYDGGDTGVPKPRLASDLLAGGSLGSNRFPPWCS